MTKQEDIDFKNQTLTPNPHNLKIPNTQRLTLKPPLKRKPNLKYIPTMSKT